MVFFVSSMAEMVWMMSWSSVTEAFICLFVISMFLSLKSLKYFLCLNASRSFCVVGSERFLSKDSAVLPSIMILY